MSWFTSMWRVWLGVALVVFLGVPVFSVVSWMVGGLFGFVAIVIGIVFVILVFSENKPRH
jgi:hypothetical protein